MATIHLVKDGVTQKGTSLTTSYEISIEDAQSKLGSQISRYSVGVPRINPEVRANGFAEYRYVVLEVHPGEEGGAFPKAGYYLLPDLAPRDCLTLMEKSGPLV